MDNNLLNKTFDALIGKKTNQNNSIDNETYALSKPTEGKIKFMSNFNIILNCKLNYYK
jgi:hypothetical protein